MSDGPIIPRALIAEQADHAARLMVLTGEPAVNPYPPGSAAAAAWQASLERQLLWHSSPESEASA